MGNEYGYFHAKAQRVKTSRKDSSLRLCVTFASLRETVLSSGCGAGVFDVSPDPPGDEEYTGDADEKIEAMKPGF